MPTNAHGQPVGAPLDRAFPRRFPAHVPLVGRTCRLVPLDDGHAEALHAAFAQAGDSLWTYMPNGPYADAASYALWIAQAAARPDPMFHAVLDTGGAPQGVASWLRIDPVAGSAEVGWITFAPALQRSVMATEAMFLMMRAIFDLGYRRYEWKCDALNAPSRRAAVRLGFTYEGTFRQATHYKGRNRDTAWFAIVDTDWPRIRAAFEAWLSPDNFDAEGRQKTRLATT